MAKQSLPKVVEPPPLCVRSNAPWVDHDPAVAVVPRQVEAKRALSEPTGCARHKPPAADAVDLPRDRPRLVQAAERRGRCQTPVRVEPAVLGALDADSDLGQVAALVCLEVVLEVAVLVT